MAQKIEIPQELFTKAVVDKDEKEHIARPNLTAFQDGWLRLKKNKAAVVSLAILVVIILLAVLGPILSKYTYFDTDYTQTYRNPSMAHPFGTDQFGRDQWARIWQGTPAAGRLKFRQSHKSGSPRATPPQ